MIKKLLTIFIFFINGYAFPQYDLGSSSSSSYSSGSNDSIGSIDILASGGYSQVIIGGDNYTGYDAFFKFLLPFSSSSNWYFGIGARYDSVTSDASSTNTSSSSTQASTQQNTFTYQSAQAGLDLAYKISFSFFDFQLNPYVYYAFYNMWTRNTNISGTTITSNSPIINNIVYGIGASLLFKISTFYFGPSAYYSQGYMECGSYTDSYGNSYNSNNGNYEIYNYNFTVGMYL